MCGILGSVNQYFDYTTLEHLKHRGPDDYGIEEYICHNHTVKFGQRRLSIIDISPAGHQPMESFCKNYSIIFNGEIYNHLELRERLPKSIVFRGHSDTETILYYIKEFGIKSITDFNGIFSIAFLDKILNKLYLARDPFGVKPLYYYFREKNNLIFSSEIRPIKVFINQPEINKDALATLLRLRYNPSPETLYTEIKKVYPGHIVEVDLNTDSLMLVHYSFLNEIPITINYTKAESVKYYGQFLEDAVKRQLLSDVEIGVFLSGGVDSAIIAALAQRHYKGKLKAFTIGFEGTNNEDEIEEASETARIELAPNFALLSVPSSSIIRLSMAL